ncbi:pyrroline-5-carboxylate dehydrogenase [Marinosulfonomonas sp. PRT-SC04]|nr:pyrroline-5-carboxylate dehydrogenase [Marinosulfonomonas sp. PRT-SC04]
MLTQHRNTIDAAQNAGEAKTLEALIKSAALSPEMCAQISARATQLVVDIRASAKPGLMEVFLAEYGLSTDEGIALMCLAEALLRVPDASTIDALIEDKIAPSNWGKHLGKSSSSLVNASTWALMLTGKVLDDTNPGIASQLHGAVKRLGEPLIRHAVSRAMREMGRQFVLGENITKAMKRATGMQKQGYTYSYDMLGEAARTEADAKRYHLAYSKAITSIAAACTHKDIQKNPGISVKLSALHPRYEVAQKDRVMAELVPRVRALAGLAKSAGMGFNIDAEEADRLSLSLDVIEAVLSDPSLAGWDGFGVVVQAFGQRTTPVIDWLYALSQKLDRRIMVRLVKGAYWDTEIKHAQVNGIEGFPVFTHKAATDISYISNAQRLLGMTDRIYPQFATHNAHTVAAILEMAQAGNNAADDYEFQRLHGMGERLHDIVLTAENSRCRIYAPVGAHRDLLAYLVRRLLENGANSSFVNQIVDAEVPPEVVAADPFEAPMPATSITRAPDLFLPERRNSKGWDLADVPTLAAIDAAREPHQTTSFTAAPLIAGKPSKSSAVPLLNPADPADTVGHVTWASTADVNTALTAAKPWDAPAAERAKILNKVADLYEENFGQIFAILTREAGKTLPDAVGELREAVDFLRYYAAQALRHTEPPVGLFTCISPWNFPLAIFSGQIAASLATGNATLAKPSEQTPLIAYFATSLLHKAGVPASALQLLPGDGSIGAALTSDARIGGVCFTGSTATALLIRSAMAENLAPGAPLIAETGGLNAMIVDSTALFEQAVRDVVQSAFQSAGQRCSALRCLYVQEDIAEDFTEMLQGAMDELSLTNPWQLSCDVGPVIDQAAHEQIADYISAAKTEGRLIKQLPRPAVGHFIAPALIQVSGIIDMQREIFGPVLHIATFKSGDLGRVIHDINATGYGLTFGLHTRIDDRVQYVVERLKAGNIYVNRNQIGAVVGSQPFGGEGLSGTGPKAGGTEYLTRFLTHETPGISQDATPDDSRTPLKDLQNTLTNAAVSTEVSTVELPGPTGESNRLSYHVRLPILCLGPTLGAAEQQAAAVRDLGGIAVLATGLPPEALTTLTGFSSAIYWGNAGRAYMQALAQRKGAILALITRRPTSADTQLERHTCVDTTASGGNATLLAEAG